MDDNGKAIFPTGYTNTNQAVELSYNYETMRWEIRLEGASFILWDSSVHNSGYPSCNLGDWEDNDTNCTITGVECEFTETETFILERTFKASDDCSNESDPCTVIYTWSVSDDDDYQAEEQAAARSVDFTASPVPFNNTLNIGYQFDYDTDVTVDVYDMRGSLVSTNTNRKYVAGREGLTSLDVSHLQNAVYLVRVTTNKETLAKKVISAKK